jgi:ribonuclease HII
MACDLTIENEVWAGGARQVAGVDEAGCGCLAGPVVAAVVVVPRGFRHRGLDDSKKLTAARRLEISERLHADSRLLIATALATVEEIDRLNILRASHLAMERAIRALASVPDGLLIDGRPVRPFPFAHRAIIGGDGRCFSIAAASVVAKVARDRLMEAAAPDFPGYGFERHKGYATAAHHRALETLGVTSLHRRSFAPVAKAAAGTVNSNPFPPEAGEPASAVA